MNISVMRVLPFSAVHAEDKYLVSTFMQHLYGVEAGIVVTILILCIALASLFAVVLGYSRVPYAAAADHNFFSSFARLHPGKHFPHVSLAVLCAAGFIFSLIMRLGDVITAILAMRILVQFMAQAVGVVLLRQRNREGVSPFHMWLYPLPVVASLIIWGFLFYSTGWFALWGTLIAATGVVVYLIREALLPRNG
jgi:fructoselysine transporter